MITLTREDATSMALAMAGAVGALNALTESFPCDAAVTYRDALDAQMEKLARLLDQACGAECAK